MQVTYKDGQVEVLAYGEINEREICHSDFLRAIELAEAKKCKMAIYVHCIGGSVIEGNLIYNTLLNSRVEKEVIITGLCASMATVVMLAADTIKMMDNAFLMLHRPSTFIDGDAENLEDAAKLLKSISENIAGRYAQMSGKTIEEVNTLWLNGKENWLDANEALEAGLINEIVTNPLVTDKPDKIQMRTNTKSVFDSIKAGLNLKTQTMKKRLVASLQLEGVDENSTEEEIIQAIERQKTSQEAVISDLLKKAEEDSEKLIDDLLDAEITAKTITNEQRAAYKEAGKTLGIAKLKAILPLKEIATKVTTPIVNIASLIKTESSTGASEESFDYLQKFAPEKLKAIHKEEPKLYAQLAKEYAAGKRYIAK